MRSRYKRGYEIERRAINELKRLGYLAVRTAGSHSPFDVIAINECEVRLIQVKSCRAFSNSIFNRALFDYAGFEFPEGCSKEIWIWEYRKGFLKFEIGRNGKVRTIGDVSE